jgi:hypothetical protein
MPDGTPDIPSFRYFATPLDAMEHVDGSIAFHNQQFLFVQAARRPSASWFSLH